MKKFIKDLAEVGKDIWNGFVWLVEAVDELGYILGNNVSKFNKNLKAKKADKNVIRTKPVTEEVYNNVVLFD